MRDLNKALFAIFAVLILNLFVASSNSHAATAVYVAQAAAGAGDGSSCANAKGLSGLSSSWSAGTTIHLCGTITSVIQVGGSGSSGNPIVLQWEQGAKLSVCSTTGALQIVNNSYITVDLGGNTAAITCPNNGASLSSQVNAVGIGSNGNGWNEVEIRNGTVGPMFVYSGTSNVGFDSVCINGGNGANNTHIHNLSITGCAEGMEIDPTANSTDEFDHLTVDASVGRLLNYATGSSGSINLSNSSFHDNDVNFTSVWVVPGDYQHYEMIHLYPTGTGNDKISNFQIYNNYIHGSSPSSNNAGSTALIFVGTGVGENSTSTSEVKFFNNIIVDTGNSGTGFSSGGGLGAYFYDQDSYHTLSIYNNTVYVPNGASNGCFSSANTGNTHNTWNVYNNICYGPQWAVYFQSSSSETWVGSNNIFYNIGNGKWYRGGTTYSSLSAWQTATGQDANSSSSNPGLNSDYTITGTSSASYQKGANLTSAGISALNLGAPQTFGQNGSCGTGCLARPASGAWDLGAYPFSSGGTSTQRPNPPSGLTATVQ